MEGMPIIIQNIEDNVIYTGSDVINVGQVYIYIFIYE